MWKRVQMSWSRPYLVDDANRRLPGKGVMVMKNKRTSWGSKRYIQGWAKKFGREGLYAGAGYHENRVILDLYKRHMEREFIL
jgi:hypothetical protein